MRNKIDQEQSFKLQRFKSLPSQSALAHQKSVISARNTLPSLFHWRQEEAANAFQALVTYFRATNDHHHCTGKMFSHNPTGSHENNMETEKWTGRTGAKTSSLQTHLTKWPGLRGSNVFITEVPQDNEGEHTIGDRKRSTITSLISGKPRIFINIQSSLQVQVNISIIITCVFLFFHLNQWVLDFWVIYSYYLENMLFKLPISLLKNIHTHKILHVTSDHF